MASIEKGVLALRSDPVKHIIEVQGVHTLEPKQKEICYAIAKYDRVAVRACHDVGKTFTMAKIVLWAGSMFPGAKIITTAPTFSQVEKLLWSEINAGYKNSHGRLGGKMLQTEWKIEADWFAYGVSPKDDAGSGETQGTTSRFQGIHGELVIIIFDEATGVHPKRWIQAEGMLTSANTKFIAVGNPTSRNCEFYRCFQSGEYKKIHISCFDSPNLKANRIRNKSDLERQVNLYKRLTDDKKRKHLKSYKVVAPKLLTASWVVSRVAKWGFDHPLTLSKVFGEFPTDDDNAMIPLLEVQKAIDREPAGESDNRSIGVDPARFGADKTVITRMEGTNVVERKEVQKKNTMEVVGIIVRMIKDHPRKLHETVVIDATGIGSGVVDRLTELQTDDGDNVIPDSIEIREVHFANKCVNEDEQEHFANIKAKIFQDLGEDLKNDLSLLDDEVYLTELPSIVYTFDSKGRFLIESKDDYKKRTGLDSPDSADSLALANYGRYASEEVGSFSKEMLDEPDLDDDDEASETIVGNLEY